MWLLLLLVAFPGPWPPSFDSRNVTNSTLQKAFASHPQLKSWLHHVIHGGRDGNWASVDDLLIDYVQRMKHAVFINDIVTIDAEDQGDLKLAKAIKEINARFDPLNHNGSVSSKRRVQL